MRIVKQNSLEVERLVWEVEPMWLLLPPELEAVVEVEVAVEMAMMEVVIVVV
jgi:hypothetical protein